MLLWKIVRQRLFSVTTRCFQLPSHTITGGIFHYYLSTIRLKFSTFVEISSSMKLWSIIIQPKTLCMTLKSLQINLICNPESTFYQIQVTVSRRQSPLMTWCTSMLNTSWSMFNLIAVLLFKFQQKLNVSTANGNYLQILWKRQLHPDYLWTYLFYWCWAYLKSLRGPLQFMVYGLNSCFVTQPHYW